jgi:hypothetical protein
MAETKFRKITLELVVQAGDVQPAKRLLREALDVIHTEYTVFNQIFSDTDTPRPPEADEYDIE